MYSDRSPLLDRREHDVHLLRENELHAYGCTSNAPTSHNRAAHFVYKKAPAETGAFYQDS